MQTQKIIQHIVNWLRDYAVQARAQGFVVGVSGGIDAAVVSTLCAQTTLPTLLLNMPIRQKIDQFDRAAEHIAALVAQYANARGETVDLTPTFEQFERTVLSGSLKSPNQDLAMANTRSRLRMTTLYYYGQINGLLVAGTGTKWKTLAWAFSPNMATVAWTSARLPICSKRKCMKSQKN